MICAEVSPFRPVAAPEDELSECYRVLKATYAVDYPTWPSPPYESFAEQMRMTTSLLGPRQFWVARVHGRIAATATATFPDRENRHLAIADVRVPPQLRRQGIGTALLRAILADIRAEGRVTLTGHGLRVDGDGEKWALGLGFRKVQELVMQALIVADVDPGLWDTSVPQGFRAEWWVGTAPPSLVAGYARARTAIDDAPTGTSSLKSPDWTVQRVRDHEAEIRGRGCELRTVVAVHEASGTVAGLTEIEVRPSRPDHAYQLDTAVLPQFRGRGLGRFVKAAMMRTLMADRPRIKRVVTQTDAANVHMIRVNHQIGYVTDYLISAVEGDIGTLDAKLTPIPETTLSPSRYSSTSHTLSTAVPWCSYGYLTALVRSRQVTNCRCAVTEP